jgi:hypothetical protein
MKKEYGNDNEKMPEDKDILEKILKGEKHLYEKLIRK